MNAKQQHDVRAQVSAEEWRLAAEVKKAYLTLWALEEQLRIEDTAVRLQERILKFFREKRELGDAIDQILRVDAGGDEQGGQGREHHDDHEQPALRPGDADPDLRSGRFTP